MICVLFGRSIAMKTKNRSTYGHSVLYNIIMCLPCEVPKELGNGANDSDFESVVTSEEEIDPFETAEIIRAKWIFDGCKTLDEIVERLEGQIERFKQLKANGWELMHEIDDDYGYIKQTAQ